jgi:hypothetical protein
MVLSVFVHLSRWLFLWYLVSTILFPGGSRKIAIARSNYTMVFDGNLIAYFPFRFRWWHVRRLSLPPGHEQTEVIHTVRRARGAFGAQAPSRAPAGWLSRVVCFLNICRLLADRSSRASITGLLDTRRTTTHTSLSMWVAAVDKIEAFLLSLLPPALAQRLRGPHMAPIVSPSSFRLKSELKAASTLLRPGTFSMQ